jgi:hypothetical protein
MQRLIRSFSTLTDQLKETFQEQYPDGIDGSHIKSMPTAKGELLRVVELRTSDAIYLIKINPESREEIAQFLDQEEGGQPSRTDDDEGGEDLEGAEGLEASPEEEEESEDDDVVADDADDQDDEEDDKDDAGEEDEEDDED